MNYRFNDVIVTRNLIAETALAYSGLRYGDFTHIEHTTSGIVGQTHCFGILLLVARDLGLLNEDFDVNLPYKVHGKGRAAILWDIIHSNFDEVSKKDMNTGDVLLSRWKDVNTEIKDIHHVMIHLGQKDKQRYGFVLHALDIPVGSGRGKVLVHRITELDYQRVERVFRLKGIQ